MRCAVSFQCRVLWPGQPQPEPKGRLSRTPGRSHLRIDYVQGAGVALPTHLAHVYSKLGVHSRGDLPGLL